MDKKREQLLPVLVNVKNPKKKPTPVFHDILQVNPIVNKHNDRRVVKGHPVIQVSEKKSQTNYENTKYEQHQRLNRKNKLIKNEEISTIIQNYFDETSQFKSSADLPKSNLKTDFLNHLKEANKQIDQAAVQLKQISNLLGTKKSKNVKTTANRNSQTTLVTGVIKPRHEEPSKIMHSCFKSMDRHFDYDKYLKQLQSEIKDNTNKKPSDPTRKYVKRRSDRRLVNTLDIVNEKLSEVRSKYFNDKPKTVPSNYKMPSKRYYSLKNMPRAKQSDVTISKRERENQESSSEAELLYKNSDFSDIKTFKKFSEDDLNDSKMSTPYPQTSTDLLREDVDKIIEKYASSVKIRRSPETSNAASTSVALDTSDMNHNWRSAVTKSKFLTKEFDMLTEDYAKLTIQHNPNHSLAGREEFKAIRKKLMTDLDYSNPN